MRCGLRDGREKNKVLRTPIEAALLAQDALHPLVSVLFISYAGRCERAGRGGAPRRLSLTAAHRLLDLISAASVFRKRGTLVERLSPRRRQDAASVGAGPSGIDTARTTTRNRPRRHSSVSARGCLMWWAMCCAPRILRRSRAGLTVVQAISLAWARRRTLPWPKLC